jgi:hypothetical protein
MLRTALLDGALLCAFMLVIILGSLRHDPRIWTNDAPPALREQVGPIPPDSKRRQKWWGALMMVGLVGISTHLMLALPSEAGFLDRMLAAYLMFATFNTFDAVVIDIGVILLWAPEWAFVPGTRGHPALRDWRFHLGAFVKGLIGGVPFSLLVAGCWAALAWL